MMPYGIRSEKTKFLRKWKFKILYLLFKSYLVIIIKKKKFNFNEFQSLGLKALNIIFLLYPIPSRYKLKTSTKRKLITNATFKFLPYNLILVLTKIINICLKICYFPIVCNKAYTWTHTQILYLFNFNFIGILSGLIWSVHTSKGTEY